MRLLGFIGPAYTLKSVNADCQRCVNLYPELNELGTGKEREIAALLPTPGLTELIELGVGPIRLIHEDPQGRIFVASADKIYEIEYSGSAWSSTLLGSVSTTTGTIKAASNKLANGDSVTVFVDGLNCYAFRNISSTETFGTFADFSYEQVDNATHVVYIDGYFIFIDGTGQFFVSEWGSFNVDPLDFASAEADPDNIVAAIANNRDLYLFNSKTTEIFVNTGNPDFPFERVQGGVVQIGCVAPYSLAEINGINFWLGRDRSGHGIIYGMSGAQAQRVSTHAIETAIQGYAIDSITAADAYTYHDGGHSFYVINFPEATWVYDLTTKLWHERAYNEGGTLERHRGQQHCFIAQYGIHLIGDYDDGRVYQFDNDVYKDDTTPIIRLRAALHISEGMKRLFHKSLQFDMETGVGLDGGVQGSNPTVMLDWSDDGGHTWSSERWASAGAIGNFKTRVRFHRLGSSRDRVYRVKVSDPVKVVLLGAELEIEAGAS